MSDHSRTADAQEAFKEKRKPKGEIKMLLSLNEEQKEVKRAIFEGEIIIVTGPAGTGKSLAVAHTALDMMFKGELSKVFITRPTQQMGDSLGFLPGQLAEKLDPYLDPFKENLYQCYDRTKVDSLLKDGRFEGNALQFLRGHTIRKGSLMIVDEAQNTTKLQMLGILTRLGKGGKIVILGDTSQKDTKEQFDGLSYAIEVAKKIEGIDLIKLKENHRSDLVARILEFEYGKP